MIGCWLPDKLIHYYLRPEVKTCLRRSTTSEEADPEISNQVCVIHWKTQLYPNVSSQRRVTMHQQEAMQTNTI